MQIVIDIPEETYDLIKHNVQATSAYQSAYYAIRRGTVLPKRHGRLVDAYALDETVYRLNFETDFETEESWKITRSEYKLIDSVLCEMPTIIEADEEANE